MMPQEDKQNTDLSLPSTNVAGTDSVVQKDQSIQNMGTSSGANNQSDDVSHAQGSSSASIQPSHTVTASTNYPQIADDNDLIEKEWVLKAKEIVSKTANDPHERNKEMNRFKADYIKKRYNKDLKLTEED